MQTKIGHLLDCKTFFFISHELNNITSLMFHLNRKKSCQKRKKAADNFKKTKKTDCLERKPKTVFLSSHTDCFLTKLIQETNGLGVSFLVIFLLI